VLSNALEKRLLLERWQVWQSEVRIPFRPEVEISLGFKFKVLIEGHEEELCQLVKVLAQDHCVDLQSGFLLDKFVVVDVCVRYG